MIDDAGLNVRNDFDTPIDSELETAPELPFFPRAVIEPPNTPESCNPLNFDESFGYVVRASQFGEISQGEEYLILGLLQYGTTQEFPGGVGLDYERVYKHLFLPAHTDRVVLDRMESLKNRVAVDAVLTPDMSALFPGFQAAAALGNVPILRLEKNGMTDNAALGFQVPSYTKGGNDTLSVRRTAVETLCEIIHSRRVHVLIVDEIIDTGTMIKGILGPGGLQEQLQKKGYPIEFIGVFALMEKLYTGAAAELRDTFGITVSSGVRIEDLWRDSTYGAGMKLSRLPRGLSFSET